MSLDDEPEDFLEKERREDPIQFAKEYMKEMKEMMRGYRTPQAAQAVFVEEPMVRIRRISNGYLMSYPSPKEGSAEVFFGTPEEGASVLKMALALLSEIKKVPPVPFVEGEPPEGGCF